MSRNKNPAGFMSPEFSLTFLALEMEKLFCSPGSYGAEENAKGHLRMSVFFFFCLVDLFFSND